jgi:hypothetical protein
MKKGNVFASCVIAIMTHAVVGAIVWLVFFLLRQDSNMLAVDRRAQIQASALDSIAAEARLSAALSQLNEALQLWLFFAIGVSLLLSLIWLLAAFWRRNGVTGPASGRSLASLWWLFQSLSPLLAVACHFLVMNWDMLTTGALLGSLNFTYRGWFMGAIGVAATIAYFVSTWIGVPLVLRPSVRGSILR